MSGASKETARQSIEFKINASVIAYAHTFFAYAAFFSALIVGCYLHYHKIVQNSSYGYPDEWFPSVSATIGDRYPERSLFQVLIALTAGPRFLLLAFNFITLYRSQSTLPYITLVSGLIRTLTCGGWVYITSTDDHDWHDIFMISYIVLTIPWTLGITLLSPKGSQVRSARSLTALLFFGMLIPLVYWFIQHKVHDIPGAYSIYAYFEWSLIILDIGFDAWSIKDFRELDIYIVNNGLSLKAQEKKTPVVTPSAEKKVEKVRIVAAFDFFDFIINTINSYILWTNISALFLCVWYFPLWHMGISGYEVVVVSLFVSPLVLGSSHVRKWFTKFPQATRVLAVVFGIGAYRVTDPENKLISITVGVVFSVISFVNEIASLSKDSKRYYSYSVSFITGLLVSYVLKYLNHSNNPIWPVMHSANGGYNDIGIFVGLMGAFFVPDIAPSDAQSSVIQSKLFGGSPVLGSIGMGGFLFTILFLLGDSSTLVLWVWNGFPITGPTPINGVLIGYIFFASGILTSFCLHPSRLSSWYYNVIFGALSGLLLYFKDGWLGYTGGLVYSFYLSSLTCVIFQAIAGYNPGIVYSLAFFVMVLLCLESIWIVAYAFVPGGWLFRERTDIVMISSFLCIQAGIFNFNLMNRKSHLMSINIGVKSLFKNSLKSLTILLALSAFGYLKRSTHKDFTPYHPETKSFTAGIWCIHFGLDNDMWSSEVRMKEIIEDAEIDIVGLLESDTQRLIGGNRDFTQKIAEDLGMYVDYGPGPNKHTWGAALLSKFPIINSTHHLLPSPVGELAPAIHATLDIYGEFIDVVVFHSGQEEDEEDRRLQSLALEEIMGNSPRPMVLLSYLVTNPLEGNYNTYVSEKSRMHDIDSTDWDRWCEYILFRGLKKVAYARISRSTITDTELQIAKFKPLTKREKRKLNEKFLYGNHFVNEKDIDEKLRMPSKLRGDGIRGHRYHVFDEPRYFAQKP